MVSLDPENEEQMETEEPVPTPKTNANKSVLDSFSVLIVNNESEKINGGFKLISYLFKNLENEKEKEYIIRRLVRSLGTSQLTNKSGYFSTLTATLKSIEIFSIPYILEVVKDELRASKTSKSEVGDVVLGKIMVCSSILRSGLMLRSDEEQQKMVIELLLKCSTKKTYLATASYLVLTDFSLTLTPEQFKSIVWNNVKTEIRKPMAEQSIDTLYFLLSMKEKFPDCVKVKKFFGVSEIITDDTVHGIADKLMNIIDINFTNHPIYALIGRLIANSDHLQLFWTSGIDSHLTKHNRNREIAALKILDAILQNINRNFEAIPELLSNNFFKLFFDWFRGLKTASKVRNLRDVEDDNKIMTKKEKAVLESLVKALSKDAVDSSVRVDVLKKLLFTNGDVNFSEITGTAIIKSIIAKLDLSGVKKMAKLFKGVLLGETKKLVREGLEREWYNLEKLKSAEYLSHLVTHPTAADEKVWRLRYMKLLMCFGFFKIKGSENITIKSDLAGSVKASFYRCLNSRMPTVESLVDILRSLCSFINVNVQKDEIREKLSKHFPTKNFECWTKLVEITDQIDTGKNNTKIDNVFLILFYQLGLFLFSEPKYVEMSRSSIEELFSCYEHYKEAKPKKKSALKQGDIDDDEPEWIEVLIEVLLSLLSQESSILRSIVQCVFKLLWEQLTPSSVEQLLSVLDPDNEDNPLMNDSDEDETDSESKNGSDQEMNGVDESESEADDDDEDMKVPDQLRMAVQKALGNAVPDTDTESVDLDNIDDEEGRKLDEALSEAFKILKQGKQGKTKKERKDKKVLTDFRIRVLDLVDIYLEKEPPMEICLRLMPPLMKCLEFCLQDPAEKPLENRLRKTIKSLTKIRKFSSTDDVTVAAICEYLNGVIDKGKRTHFIFQALGDKITECGSFMVHCLLKIQKPSKKKSCPVIQIYKEALESFFKNRNCLLPKIFFHSVLQIEWLGNYELAKILIENAFNIEVRQFRRNEALELLQTFLVFLQRCKPENVSNVLKPIEELFFEKTVETLPSDTFIAKDIFFKLLHKIIDTLNKLHSNLGDKCSVNIKQLTTVVNDAKKGATNKRNESKSDVENGHVEKEKQNVKRKSGNVSDKIKKKKSKLSKL